MVRQNSSAAVVLQLLSFLQVSRCVSAKEENAATSPLGVVTSAPERTEEWSFPSCLHYSLSGTHRVQRSTIRVDCYSCPVTPTFRAGSHHLCSALLRRVRERDTHRKMDYTSHINFLWTWLDDSHLPVWPDSNKLKLVDVRNTWFMIPLQNHICKLKVKGN